jgi:general secretion pathway protein D
LSALTLFTANHHPSTLERSETPRAGTGTHPYETGMKLEVTPHLGEGELLKLDIVLTHSDILKRNGSGSANVVQEKIDMTVTLPQGATTILGGMPKQNDGKWKVPILGDVPLLGGLFRGGDDQDAQSKLYLFISAEILHPDE